MKTVVYFRVRLVGFLRHLLFCGAEQRPHPRRENAKKMFENHFLLSKGISQNLRLSGGGIGLPYIAYGATRNNNRLEQVIKLISNVTELKVTFYET